VIAHWGCAPDSVVTLHLGVSDCFFADVRPTECAALRKRYHLPERYFLWVGNLEPKKNIPLLMQAHTILKQHRDKSASD
jgi:hypothetical protein